MARYQHGDADEDGEEIAVCDGCDGTGKGDWTEDDEGEEVQDDCPLCSGFGRLDW